MSTLTPAAPRAHPRPTALNTGPAKFGGKSRMDPTRNNTAAGIAAWLLALLFAVPGPVDDPDLVPLRDRRRHEPALDRREPHPGRLQGVLRRQLRRQPVAAADQLRHRLDPLHGPRPAPGHSRPPTRCPSGR
jgi:hypothetical protein